MATNPKNPSKAQSLQSNFHSRMSCTRLLAQLIHNYIQQNHFCPFETPSNSNDHLSTIIIQNIYVVGGAIRNFLLKHPINDLDIVIDTKTLSTLQLNHLRKFHAPNRFQKPNSSVPAPLFVYPPHACFLPPPQSRACFLHYFATPPACVPYR